MIKNKDSFENMSIKVPLFIPSITKDDTKNIQKVLNSTYLTDGPKLRQFENEFAKFTGAKYAVGLSNATSALHLSLKSLGIGNGDEVIVPNITFVATANAVILAGAKPILVEVNYDDMNISTESILENLSDKVRAILPVHFAGKPANMNEITHIAKKNNLLIIEDCAHAIGTKKENRHVGTFGNTGCFSFYPTKNITTIEGGMVITNNNKIAEKIRLLRNHGISRTLSNRYKIGKPWDYDIKFSGYNYRLDEVRSSLGLNQLKRIEQINNNRFIACKYYNSKLKNIEGIEIPKILPKNENSYHLYIIKIKENYGISRDELYKKLLKVGIRTTVHYKPLHLFSAFKKMKRSRSLKNSNKLYRELLSLPLYTQITKKEQNQVINYIKKFKK
jgi:perosamine synthetase